MAPELHTALSALVERFYVDDLSEEEWALLKIHMAYCTDCEIAFLALKSAVGHLLQPNSLN